MRGLLKYSVLLFIGVCVASCGTKEKESVEQEDEPVVLLPVDQTAYLSGRVGRGGGVHMVLDIKGKNVKGIYYYDKYGKNHGLTVEGKLNDEGMLELFETNAEGRPTGHFAGYFGNSFGYKGNFVNYNATRSTYELHTDSVRDNAGDGDGRGFLSNLRQNPTIFPEVSVPDYYGYAGNLGYDNNYSTGSYDWDSLLDSYEKYVDKYIAVIRKINSGDASVANEYASLLMQAQDLDKRIRDCSGDLSAAQLSRYQRINNKLLQAAQELRH